MPTVMIRFFQATYVLATFVHISNISGVTNPILTELFGSNFLGSFDPKLFLTQKFFRNKCFLGPTTFWPVILLDPKKFLSSKFFRYKFIFFTSFFRPKSFVRVKISLDPIFLWKHIFFGPNICFGLIDFHWRQGIQTFQVDALTLKSC